MDLQDCLKQVLDVYEPECRYLKKIDVDDNKAYGEFSVPSTCYAIKGRKYHLNAAEDVILYEQIMYAFVGNLFINGLNDVRKIPMDMFFPTVVDKHVLIVSIDSHYKAMVNSDFFTGVLTTNKMRRLKNGDYHLKQNLSINEGAHELDVSIYLDLKDLSLPDDVGSK